MLDVKLNRIIPSGLYGPQNGEGDIVNSERPTLHNSAGHQGLFIGAVDNDGQ